MDVNAYRRSAEAFLIDLTREYYLHYAGLKETYEIEPIYGRHEELFTARAIDDLRERRDATEPGSDDSRRLRMLLDFAVEGHLGEQTKALETELAHREATLTLKLEDRRMGFRESSVIQANEPDAEVRATIEWARNEATESELGAPISRDARATAPVHRRARLEQLQRDVRGVQVDRPGSAALPDRRVQRRQRGRISRDARAGGAPNARDRAGASCAARISRGSSGRRRRTGSSRPIGSCRASWRRCSGSASMSPTSPPCTSTSTRARTRRRERSAPRCACPARSTSCSRRSAAATTSRAHARGRPHRALRPRRPAVAIRVPVPGRQRDHRGLRVPVRAPDRGSRVAAAPAGNRGRRLAACPRPRPAAHLHAPLRGQARLRAGAPRRAARPLVGRAVAAVRTADRRRAADRVALGDVPGRRRPGLLLRVLPAGLGARDAPAGVSARPLRAGVVR